MLLGILEAGTIDPSDVNSMSIYCIRKKCKLYSNMVIDKISCCYGLEWCFINSSSASEDPTRLMEVRNREDPNHRAVNPTRGVHRLQRRARGDFS